MKKIVFIPPNGQIKKQDFLFDRLASYLCRESKTEVILICLENEAILNKKGYSHIIQVKSRKDILNTVEKISCDMLICRGWMHAYPFCADIVKRFKDAIVIIKDWNFASQKEYEFLFGNDKDFDAIEYIFRHAKYILSHYFQEQSEKWAEEFGVSRDKFIFFPEYCNETLFNTKSLSYDPENTINMVLAGTLAPTCFPEECYVSKGIMRAAKTITKQNIAFSLVFPPASYEYVMGERELYRDLLYENTFNSKIRILKGSALKPSVLDPFDFGLFLLEYTTKNEYLNKYAVPSKFAFYLEAGIPMLINEKMEALASYVQKYNLGLVFSNDDIYDFERIIKISKERYNRMLNSINEFRQYFTFEYKGLKCS